MKTLKHTLFYTFICIAMAFTSCSSDDNGDGGEMGGEPDPASGVVEHLTAKIDGTDFIASLDPASLIGATKSTTNGMTIVTGQGSTNNGDFINFSIIGYTGPGEYKTGDELTNPNGIMYGEIDGGSPQAWSSGLASNAAGLPHGTITITVDADGELEGTFSFEGYNGDDMSTKSITEGSFKAVID